MYPPIAHDHDTGLKELCLMEIERCHGRERRGDHERYFQADSSASVNANAKVMMIMAFGRCHSSFSRLSFIALYKNHNRYK